MTASDHAGEMRAMRERGTKLADIAARFGVSKQRVQQIIGSTGCLELPSILGQSFGGLVVVREEPPRHRHSFVVVRCGECGQSFRTRRDYAKHGRSPCACRKRTAQRVNRVGQRFGRLVVLRQEWRPVERSTRARCYAVCRCDCGRTCEVMMQSLVAGGQRGCGCASRQWAARKGIRYVPDEELEVRPRARRRA